MKKQKMDILVVGAISQEEKDKISNLLSSFVVEFAHKLSIARSMLRRIQFRAIVLLGVARRFVRDLIDRKFLGKILFVASDKKEKTAVEKKIRKAVHGILVTT